MKISLKNITKKFGNTIAVNNFNADLPDGNLICLLGPSGCGKSTILNMLCGIINPTSGQIFFDDEEVTKLPPDKRNIGMVFQNYALYPHLTVLDNICFPLEVQKVPKKERREKAIEIAKLVHVDSLLQRFPGELSGGQQQRVAIARALIKKPKILLMDEPLSNLDARLRLEMREEIRRIQKETGVTTVFVTHDQDEAMAISDSIILMKDGILMQEGDSQELYNSPDCKFVAEFLGNPPVNVINVGKEIKQKCSVLFENSNIFESIRDNSALETRDVVLAIRPESFVLTEPSNSSFKCKISRLSQMGKENIAYFGFLGQEVRAILTGDEDLTLGQEINISLKKRGVFLFDSETGERLF